MRFVVPVRNVPAAANPKYFHCGRGVSWYNLLSEQCTGLNAITVPGTLRGSLVLLAVVLERQTDLQPTQIMADTGAHALLARRPPGRLWRSQRTRATAREPRPHHAAFGRCAAPGWIAQARLGAGDEHRAYLAGR